MTTLKPELSRVEWRFGLWWVLGTIVGWVVGFTICEAIKAFLASLAHALEYGLDGAVLGTCIGIAQWLVLRRLIPRAGWWLLASIIGFAVGKGVSDVVAHETGFVGFGGAAIGAVLGIAQWIVLRRHVAQAGWWVLASALAWAVGWGIISVVDEAASGPTGTTYVVGASGAAVAGVITAVALVRLLRQRRA